MIHWISIDALLEALNARGFDLGVDVHVRILRFLEKSAQKPPKTEDDFKYRLAALVCRSPVQQSLFYEVYAETLALLELETHPQETTPPPFEAAALDQQPLADRPPNWQQPPPADLPDPEGPPPVQQLPTENTAANTTRTGPVRLNLQFPPNPLRPWNTTAIDQALRPLREKEWAGTTEWDIPASIRNSIRAGGTPQFVTRRRKKAPQYLLLIDQRSTRDHLAGLYAELAAEMNRRDLSAECFFYDFIPFRCWRDFRDLRTHTDIAALQGEYAGYKLLIVGEPDGLLDLPDLRPSNLAIDLRDHWKQVALLCTKPTAAWTNAEWALGQLFPVAPANAAGLRTLPYQWQAAESIHPPYWLQEQPEPNLPELSAEEWPALQRRLQRYLGIEGFHWLCATAVYPELYWELTTLLNDESIPPTPGALEQDLNQQWQTALQRLSRLSWFRQGMLPPAVRTELLRYFKTKMPAVQRSEVRRQLIEILGLDDNRPPDGSWAAADKAFMLVHLEAGRAADESTADVDAAQQRAWTLEAEALDSAQRSISQADLEEAIGRKLNSTFILDTYKKHDPITTLPPPKMLSVLIAIGRSNPEDVDGSRKEALRIREALTPGFEGDVVDPITLYDSTTERLIETLNAIPNDKPLLGLHLTNFEFNIILNWTEQQADSFKKIIKQQPYFRFIFLNGSHTQEAYDKLLSWGIPVLIVGQSNVLLDIAHDFPVHFYSALAAVMEKRTLSQAFDDANALITANQSKYRTIANLDPSPSYQIYINPKHNNILNETFYDWWKPLEDTIFSTPYLAFTTPNQLNARKGPGTSFETVGTLGKNARVVVLEVSGDWLRIGRERWIHRMYVDRPQALRPEDWLILATVTPTFSVLWVDDKPEPNRNLRKELTEKFGIQSLICHRTEEALKLLKETHFDLIVTDTTREGNPWAGIDMFQELKALNISIPRIASTSAEKAAQYEAEFLETGALGVFSRDNSMKDLVERLVQEKAQRFAPPQATTEPAVFQLLWVDDFPHNNTRWIDALKAKHAGMVIQTALSTEAALAELDKNQYQAVISDLGRGNNHMEGLRFLETLRANGTSLPIAIFAARTPDNQTILLEAGAQLATNNGSELLTWVEDVINAWEKNQLTPPPVVEQTAQTYTPPRLVLDPAMVPERPLKVFIGYAHRNKEYLISILGFLEELEDKKYIDVWHDERMEAGQNWQKEVNQQLYAADVVLFLITSDLLKSESTMTFEFNLAMARARNHELRIVPLIVEPCDWQSTPLGAWPALPADGDTYNQKTRLEDSAFPWEPLDTLLYNLAISKKENWTWPLEPATSAQSTSASEEGPLQAGMTLDRRYALLERIGRGSYGQIWRVEDVQEGVELSLKIELSTKETSVDAFRREYELLSKFQHPNILRYVYFGVWEGQPYLVMPYYAKGSVARIKGKIAETELWRLAAQMASALAHLHAQSPPILHRDVKPQNILFGHDEGYILGDFGISGPEGAPLRGLPAVPYRAPECADTSSARYSPASDVWALGVTLYELATGTLPFGGRGGTNTGTTVSLPEQFSPALGGLLKACLAVEPGARPSAETLAREAEEYVSQAQRQAPEATAPAPEFVQDANNPAAIKKAAPKTAAKKERTVFQRLFGLGKEEEPEIAPPEMIFVKGGTFQMGQEGIAAPVHPVTLSDFEIGKYPVTQKLWVDIMGNNPSQFKGDDLPVESVSWLDAQDFLKKLNTLFPEKGYRLPTEAEWEFAARGGILSKGYTYAGSNDLKEVGWFSDNSGSKTHVVGQKKANELGIHDMSGNVSEWCADWYDEYKDSKQPIYNPTGSAAISSRVVRGGSWAYGSTDCRVANRNDWGHDFRFDYLGFRLAKDATKATDEYPPETSNKRQSIKK